MARSGNFQIGIPGDFRLEKQSDFSVLSDKWNLEMIKFPNEECHHTYGKNVKIAILDTGYSKHDILPDPSAIYHFGHEKHLDHVGHGTHVYGIVASIAKNATFLIYKVLGRKGTGSYKEIADAIMHAADQGADILQISIGGTSPHSRLHDAVKYANSKGCVIVCAAGNSGKNENYYPAAYNECISVGSVGMTKILSNFSTVGAHVDLVAPGEQIVSTWINNAMRASSGTSMAAPHVSGVAALLIDHGLAHYGKKLSGEEVKKLLYANAEDLGLIGWDSRHGKGLVQVQFHDKVKDLTVDAPRWVNLLIKLFAIALNYYLKKRLK